jgi:hypothetical protein
VTQWPLASRVLAALSALWLGCVIYFFSHLAWCGANEEASCSGTHATVNEIVFDGILYLPLAIAAVGIAGAILVRDGPAQAAGGVTGMTREPTLDS